MSNLLQVSRMPTKAMSKKGVFPLYMEFKVSAEAAPYLVSSTKGSLWVENPSSTGLVRAAIRQGATPAVLFKEIVEAVVQRGRESQWGNVQPFTPAGLKAALAHVNDYDMGKLEVLLGAKKGATTPEWLQPLTLGVPVRKTSWLPEGTAVVVPSDRNFVGLLEHLGTKHVVFTVHNASRGIAVAVGD